MLAALLPAAAQGLTLKQVSQALVKATPGKMAFSAVVVDAATHETPDFWQALTRYVGYFVSTTPLFAGLVWVAFDARKQGWHDKMARTVVIYRRR